MSGTNSASSNGSRRDGVFSPELRGQAEELIADLVAGIAMLDPILGGIDR